MDVMKKTLLSIVDRTRIIEEQSTCKKMVVVCGTEALQRKTFKQKLAEWMAGKYSMAREIDWLVSSILYEVFLDD